MNLKAATLLSKSTLSALLALVLLCLWTSAQANTPNDADRGTEWRLLGPAFSVHASDRDAPITRPLSGVWELNQSKTLYEGKFLPEQRAWSGTNPAIGIEVSTPASSHAGATTARDLAFVSMVRDSFGKMGVMAGIGRSWPIAQFGTVSVEAGASGGLWYRTVSEGNFNAGRVDFCFRADQSHYGPDCVQSQADYRVTDLRRRIVPFVLPFLSITESTTGLGVNLAVAPKFRIGRDYSVPTTTVMVQITYKLNF